MKKTILFLLASCYVLIAQKKTVSPEDIWKYYKFYPINTSGAFKWTKKSPYIFEKSPEGDLVKVDILRKDYKPQKLLAKKDLPDSLPGIKDFSFSPDEQKILLLFEKKPLYRHSFTGKYFVYDLKQKKHFPVFHFKEVREVTFSPDGKNIAFVYKNNLYIQSVENPEKITRITKDGEINKIINGHSDWVYEEEFGLLRAYEWSPSGKAIAFLRFDESKVKEFTMMTYKGNLYPQPVTFKYPKAGEENSKISLHIYKLTTGTSYQSVLPSDFNDFYIPGIKWHPTEEKLYYLFLNRKQNHVQLWQHKLSDKSDVKILEEKSDTYLQLDAQTWFFLPANKGFLWRSEKDGYYHIYHYNWEGKLIKQITKGNYEVLQILGYDPKSDYIFYSSTEKSPLEKHIYKIKINGTGKTALTSKQGSHSARFSPDFKYWIHTYSDDLLPTQITIENTKTGKTEKVLVNNKALQERISEYNISPKEYFKIPLKDGTELNAWMIKPSDFDSTKQYPVLMFVYGGPGSQTVKRGYDGFNFFWYQYLAANGYIVVSVDNRGTGARGRKFRTITYKKLGKIEAEDQAEAANYLKKLPFIHPERVGIWGWSFGGYLTSLCLVKFPGTFKTGIAVAPVTHWKFYDTIYTERFLQTPEENPEGYEQNSPINFAHKLEDKYMIVHGSADDNVHIQNSMEMINALIKADKQFELLVYPDQNHSIFGYNTRLHLFRAMSEFLFKNL